MNIRLHESYVAVHPVQVPHISTGAMLRATIQAGTPLELEVKQIIEGGGLIDDSVMTRLVCDRLKQSDAAAGFLLDGYPRTIPQAQSLDQLVQGRQPLMIVEIVLSEEEVLHRLASRLVCEECGNQREGPGPDLSCHDCGGPLVPRADDAEEMVRNRLAVYRRQTVPLVEDYSDRSLVNNTLPAGQAATSGGTPGALNIRQ